VDTEGVVRSRARLDTVVDDAIVGYPHGAENPPIDEDLDAPADSVIRRRRLYLPVSVGERRLAGDPFDEGREQDAGGLAAFVDGVCHLTDDPRMTLRLGDGVRPRVDRRG
jgi:hypothetical protein